jgi:NADH dehydrogenase
MFGMHISGFLAWFLWRGVYLFKLPTWSCRSKVALDWGWDVLFPRDTAQQITHTIARETSFTGKVNWLASSV